MGAYPVASPLPRAMQHDERNVPSCLHQNQSPIGTNVKAETPQQKRAKIMDKAFYRDTRGCTHTLHERVPTKEHTGLRREAIDGSKSNGARESSPDDHNARQQHVIGAVGRFRKCYPSR